MTVKKTSQSTFNQISMSLIDPPDGHVRMDILERKLFELSESMKEVGLIQAILVTPVKERYEVVVGHRRYLAAKKLKWKTIKAEIREMERNEVAVLRATENLQREGLSPIEEAAIYADLFDQKGFTIKMIADKMGRSAHLIQSRMDLLKMDPEVQKAIHSGKVQIGVAKIISKIGDKKELYRYLEIAIENGVTPKVALLWVDEFRKSLQYLNSREQPPSLPDETLTPQTYYTACQICEGPMEYKDMNVIKVCKACFDNIIKALNKGGE